MKVLFTTVVKPIPIFLNRFLSIDDMTYRFIGDQGPFSVTCDVPAFALHFLAHNLLTPSVLLEWPTEEELEAELRSDTYDYVAISFKVIDLRRIVRQIELIRRVSPESKIVLGGYGTLAFSEPRFAHVAELADYICSRGDGVDYLRKLLGEPVNRPKKCHLPIERIQTPWLAEAFHMESETAYILSALGCEWKCEFCCTSAYAEGQVIEVLTPEEIVESMKWYYRTHPALKEIFMMDEDILVRRPKVEAIGKLIREDPEFGLSRMSYLAFGTIKALSGYDPEELLLNGVGKFWSGIESKFSYNRKKGDCDAKALIQTMQDAGIEAQLSWILGDDCQTKDNIDEDIDDLVSYKPETVQLTILSAFPGTGLFRRLKDEGRLADVEPDQYCALGDNMKSLHFTHQERVDLVMKTYRRIYETHGPSIIRALETDMNGYEFCSRSRHPVLNTVKRDFFKKRVSLASFLLPAAIATAPTATARKNLEDTYQRRIALFGPLSKMQRMMADRAVQGAEKEAERRTREAWPTIRHVDLKRFVYEGLEDAAAAVSPAFCATALPVLR